MPAFLLKIIAMSTMLVDHSAIAFADSDPLMRMIGRPAFILYAFLMAESYYHLQDKPDRLKAHTIKLLALCIVSEAAHDLFDFGVCFETTKQSVLGTLTLGFVALIASGWWSRRASGNRLLKAAGCVMICLAAAGASYCIRSEYKFAGVLLICMFYVYLNISDGLSFEKRASVVILLLLAYLAVYYWSASGFRPYSTVITIVNPLTIAGTCLTLFPIALYDRRLGYNSRWFRLLYSSFYPLHLAILYVLVYRF